MFISTLSKGPKPIDFSGAPRPLLLSGLLLMVACHAILDPDEDRRIGVIAFYGEPIVIELPDTLYAGISFDTAIRTYAKGCDSKGTTKVRGDGQNQTVDITPFDIIYTGPKACDDTLEGSDG